MFETASEDDEGLLEFVVCVMLEKLKMLRYNLLIVVYVMMVVVKVVIGDWKKRRAVVFAAVDEEAYRVGALVALVRISVLYMNKF